MVKIQANQIQTYYILVKFVPCLPQRQGPAVKLLLIVLGRQHKGDTPIYYWFDREATICRFIIIFFFQKFLSVSGLELATTEDM